MNLGFKVVFCIGDYKEGCGVGKRRVGVFRNVLKVVWWVEWDVGSFRGFIVVCNCFFSFMVRLYNIFDYWNVIKVFGLGIVFLIFLNVKDCFSDFV